MFPLRSGAILEIRQRADMERDPFVRDPELIRLANHNIRSIYKDCITAFGDHAYAKRLVIGGLAANQPQIAVVWPNTAKTTSGTSLLETTEFSMPTDFARLLRCDWVRGNVVGIGAGNGGNYYTIAQDNIMWTPMNPVDLPGMVYDGTPREWREGEVQYWLKTLPGGLAPEHGTDAFTVWWMAFLPPPQSVVSVNIFYLPMAPGYTDGDDPVGIRLPDEAWTYVVNATAADMLAKKRADTSELRQCAMAARAELQGGNISPDQANPMATVDISGWNGARRNVWGGR